VAYAAEKMTETVKAVPIQTLPDLLRDGLDVVFVGINPSIYSVERGHYFARPSNRFWPCLSRSILSRKARQALSVERLGPEHDRALLDHGIGFTDLVKRATAKASDLAPSEFTPAIRDLLTKLERDQPRIACFHGVTGFRPVHRLLMGQVSEFKLGLQDLLLGPTRVYLVPNPSGANAHVTRLDQTRWYDLLAECLAKTPASPAR
jgi:TDG/mug DNA glycosylase family protein